MLIHEILLNTHNSLSDRVRPCQRLLQLFSHKYPACSSRMTGDFATLLAAVAFIEAGGVKADHAPKDGEDDKADFIFIPHSWQDQRDELHAHLSFTYMTLYYFIYNQ